MIKPESTKANRRQTIEELRYQLRYASTHEREDIRRELNFWLNYR